jgi:hypothetical protein
MLGAERATAGPDRDLGSIAWPIQHVANVSTVALALDSHDLLAPLGWRLLISGREKAVRCHSFCSVRRGGSFVGGSM